MDDDLTAVKEAWVARELESIEYPIDAQRLLDWANACGETDPRFVDPDHDDFQSHPTFTCCLGSGKMLPEDFPQLGNGRGLDGGKSVVVHGPVRPGDVLRGRAAVADIYPKTGRSGTMIFIVHRTEFTNQRGEPVSTVDWRMIQATDS